MQPHRSALLLTTVLAGCTVFGIDGNPAEEEKLARAEARWERVRPQEYSYVLERQCYCLTEALGPVRVVVRGDSVLERTYTASGAPVPVSFARLFGPMDSVFAVVGQALEQGADELAARYHSGYGYPVVVDIDYIENAVDDELGLRVREFAVHDLTRQ